MLGTIAVVAGDSQERDDLLDHLTTLGYAPRRCPSLVGAGDDLAVLLVRGREDVHLLAGLTTYLGRGRPRLVVIAREPELIRRLAAPAHLAALSLLVPPVLLGQLGDALREAGSQAP